MFCLPPPYTSEKAKNRIPTPEQQQDQHEQHRFAQAQAGLFPVASPMNWFDEQQHQRDLRPVTAEL